MVEYYKITGTYTSFMGVGAESEPIEEKQQITAVVSPAHKGEGLRFVAKVIKKDERDVGEVAMVRIHDDDLGALLEKSLEGGGKFHVKQGKSHFILSEPPKALWWDEEIFLELYTGAHAITGYYNQMIHQQKKIIDWLSRL